MSAKHTPGPWRLSFDEATGAFGIEDDNRIAILCSRAPWGHRAQESIANGRLIAAAPELLDAAKALIAQVDAILLPDDPQTAALRAAIAKATGSGT